MRDILKAYSADEARDDRGRWTAGGATEEDHRDFQRATLRPRDGDEVRKPAREILHQAVTYLHDKAAQLASKVRQTISSTKFAGASPTAAGGLELRARHTMPNGQTLQSHVQLNPWNFPAGSGAGKIVTVLHHGLVQSGVPYATPKNPVGVTFTDRRGRRGRS